MRTGTRKVYVGIDVHHIAHKVAIIPTNVLEQPGENWKRVEPLTMRNSIEDFSKLDAAIKMHANGADEVAIAVDHTGGHYSEPIMHFLNAKGYAVYYLEAKAVKAARERLLDEEDKSDVIDSTSSAYLLYLRDLHGLSFRIPETIPELGSEAMALNALVLQRWQFTRLAVQATNRLHQFMLALFPEGELQYFHQLLKIVPYYPTPHDIVASNGLQSVEGISATDKNDIVELATHSVGVPGDTYRWLVKTLTAQRQDAMARCKEITSMIRTKVNAHPYGPILLSFPFIREVNAATIIAITRDINRWPNKKKFKKAFGVYARLKQSGSSSGRIRRGKEGNRHGRRVLFQVCFGCIRSNASDNDFRDYYLRQVYRGKPRIKALVSTMGKLAEIIYHCLKTGEHYSYKGTYKASLYSEGSNSVTR